MAERIILHVKNMERESSYEIPYQKGVSVLWALRYIYDMLDAGLAYPLCLCKIGKCGACAVRLDGKTVLSCTAMLTSGEHRIEMIPEQKPAGGKSYDKRTE